MDKVIAFLEKYFVPVAGEFGSQRNLVVIRDGFVAIMPLIILGSFAVLLNNLPIDAYQNLMAAVFGENWTQFGGFLWQGTFAIVSLLVSFSIAYQLARSYDKDALSAGIISLASLLILMETVADGAGLPLVWAGAQGLFIAIVTALISTEIFSRLSGNRRLVIRMPEGVPPAVARSFASLLPAMITLIIFGLLKVLLVVIGSPDLHQVVYDLIQAPVSAMANTLGSAIVIALVVHVFWFFGLHGPNIIEPLMQAVYLPAIEANAAAFEAGGEIPYIVTKPFFDAFIYLGGSGVTIALIVAVFLAGRRHKHYRNISGMSVAPGLFNINEPILFGFPIVLNPLLVIPFILTPIILTIVSYVSIAIGLVPKTIVFIPWTTPPVIGGVLATGSWQGGVLAFVNLVIAILLYVPFVKMAERTELRKLQGTSRSKTAVDGNKNIPG